jgi:hypothetical protein
MMGSTNITGTVPCRLFTEHQLRTLMFSVNKLDGSLPACVLGVSGTHVLSMARLNPPESADSACHS